MLPPTLRVARPTRDLQVSAALYAEGLGLERLGGFEDHAGFHGVMLGRPGWPYHLELTWHPEHPPPPAPSPDDLLVFYFPDPEAHAARCRAMARAGFEAVASLNPYWDAHGRSFQDPDGYRVVIARGDWGREEVPSKSAG